MSRNKVVDEVRSAKYLVITSRLNLSRSECNGFAGYLDNWELVVCMFTKRTQVEASRLI